MAESMSTELDAASHAGDHDDHGLAHVMPIPMLFGVFVVLVGLTLLTVWASDLGLGQLEIVVALGIATVKSLLVALFFMHLYYDKPLNGILFALSLLFAALFIGLTLYDVQAYHPQVVEKEIEATDSGSVRMPALP